ncbi:MAG: hypothetical protein IIB60_03240 [Planctomycetes bacterium]|nr:hypothetical protein [Planctomycetota bacterium]
MQKGMILTTVLGIMAVCGCQGTVTCNDVAGTTADINGNGFVDITPPPGVEFDSDRTIKIIGANTLVAADLAPFAKEHGVDPNLVNLAEFLVRFSFDIEYENGETQTICQSFPFDKFETRFEVACPKLADMNVELIALVPILGIPIATIPVGFTLDAVDYECGDTVSILTTIDESGQVV